MGLDFFSAAYPRPLGLHALLGTGDMTGLWWKARVSQLQWSVHSRLGPGCWLHPRELLSSVHLYVFEKAPAYPGGCNICLIDY